MSNEQAPRGFFGASKIEAKPKYLVTLTIDSVKARPSNDDKTYDSIEIITTGTKASVKKPFPSLLMRPEWFAGNFDPEVYTNYAANPELEEVPEGKKMTKGQSLKFVYNNNIFPEGGVSVPSKGKNAGKQIVKAVTTLMAIAGGTIEGLYALTGAFSARIADTAAPKFEGTVDQVAEVLNAFLKARDKAPTLLVVVKQGQDQNGDLKDGYEVDRWVGPFTEENWEKQAKRIKDTENEPEVGKQLKLGFNPQAR